MIMLDIEPVLVYTVYIDRSVDMKPRRKTYEVDKIREKANRLLEIDNEYIGADVRRGIAILLEHILHESGNYAGFNYVAWSKEGGCERWWNDGQPNDNTSYLGDQTRRVYY